MNNDTASKLHTRIYRICLSRRLSHDDAMDVAQDVLYKAVKYTSKINELESWVISCTFNAIKDLAKKRKHLETYQNTVTSTEHHDAPPSNDDELKFVVDLMLSCLTEKQQTAIARWLNHSPQKGVPLSGKDRILVFRAFKTCREKFAFAEVLVST